MHGLCSQLNLALNMLCGLDWYGRGTYTAEGIIAISDALQVNGGLTATGTGGLNLKDNELGDKGWGAVIAGVCSSHVCKLTSIDVSNESIGPAGAGLLAEARRTSVNGVLTSRDVRINNLGDEGETAICKAVEGREGFDLKM